MIINNYKLILALNICQIWNVLVLGIHSIWLRLFDHRSFLNGEIQYTLREFEQKRNDKEVENLFVIVENIAEIKDSQIDKTKVSIESIFPQIQLDLTKANHMLKSIEELEQKYKADITLETKRENRKQEWKEYLEDFNVSCSKIDTTFEEKEEELVLFYKDLERIESFRSRQNLDLQPTKLPEHKLLTTKSDRDFITSLNLNQNVNINFEPKEFEINAKDKLLSLEDLHWLNEQMVLLNKDLTDKVYFHEIFQGSEILVPKNREIPRNPVLEERCQKLKAQQENRVYNAMTKNIDNVRQKFPEDTIAFQMKQINGQLIAVFQFIVSVLAGFAFGFMGVEVFVGSLDFGFRLLLGIICALVIALAELYFLAKKLNENLEFETAVHDGTFKEKYKKEKVQ